MATATITTKRNGAPRCKFTLNPLLGKDGEMYLGTVPTPYAPFQQLF